MSKQIKQMEMDSLKKTFGEVRDLVLLSVSGVNAIAENQMRLALRKKSIRMHMVKNSLVARVFKELGINLDQHLTGPTTIAWGPAGVAELSKEIDAFVRKNAKLKPKAAVADGAVVSFDEAKRFPTRAEAIGQAMAQVLGPARQLVALLQGPGARLAGQIKAIADKAPPEPEASGAA
jgi:large subunit ribosomal protein L10